MDNTKIKIAVSSCLLGEAVRYDGSDKHIEYVTQQLSKEYNLISLCPEMAIGMGVPRPPIHLINLDNTIQAVAVENPENNVSKKLIEYGELVVKNHSDICGFILKKNSPSCGIKNVKVLNKKGEYERNGQGLFAATVMKVMPLLPVIDEEDFTDIKLRNNFLLNVTKHSKKACL